MVLIDILPILDKSDAETCLKDEVRDESMHYARNPNPDLGPSSESRAAQRTTSGRTTMGIASFCNTNHVVGTLEHLSCLGHAGQSGHDGLFSVAV